MKSRDRKDDNKKIKLFIRRKEARDRIELIKLARELNCSVEDLV